MSITPLVVKLMTPAVYYEFDTRVGEIGMGWEYRECQVLVDVAVFFWVDVMVTVVVVVAGCSVWWCVVCAVCVCESGGSVG